MKLKRWLFTEFSTPKKSYNLLLAVLQWRFFKNSRLITYPAFLTICPGNVCNLKCVLCPTGRHDKGRKQGLMNFDRFKQIIDECGPYAYEVSLYNWGEPLLNKDIFKMVRYAKKYKIRIVISTNLMHLDDTICSEFVHSGVDDVVVSLDGASQQSVIKYQVGNNFDKIIANMGKLAAYRRKLEANKPSITWRFLVNKFNEHELEKADKLSKKIGIDLLKFNKFRCDMGRELTLSEREQYANVSFWLPEDESLSMYDYSKKGKKKIKINDCEWLWFKSSINWNGAVSPCCAVWNEKYDFGNIGDSTFGELWNSSKYRQARRIVRGDLLEAPDNICSVCKSNKAAI
jgi:radical SAM protein with 4Fe4S-binding SPASM domain